MLRWLAALLLAAGPWPLMPAAAQSPSQPPHSQLSAASTDGELDHVLNEEIIRLPVNVKLVSGAVLQRDFVLTIFKPDGNGPFPTVIVSHGRDYAKRAEFGRNRVLRFYFVRRGFVVLAPTRIGYGVSGYDIDPERSYGSAVDCDTWRYEPLANNVTKHIEATIAFARTQSWFDKKRVLLAGVSAGGFGSLVAAGEIPSDIAAVINFAGGIGGDDERPERPCNPRDVALRLAAAASKRQLPSIWIYAENDHYWGNQVPRDWHAAYLSAGGRAQLLMLQPIGDNGHDIIDPGIKFWRPQVDRFLSALGFSPRKAPLGTPLPTGFASLEDASSLPLVNDQGREGYRAFLEFDIPRAFAIGPNGAWASVGGNLTAVDSVLARCRGFAGAVCRLYTVNDDVVWKP